MVDGRLNLSGVGLLAPYLTRDNADELLKVAAHKTKSKIDRLLAERFPRSEMLAMVHPAPASTPRSDEQPASGPAGDFAADFPAHVLGSTCQHAPAHVEAPSRPKLAPIARQRFELHVNIGQGTNDKLLDAQELLSHRIPSADLAEVLDRALDALIRQLEKQKFAATPKPRTRSRSPSANARHIPAQVKRAVWQRDQGQCTLVSATGHRCPSRKFLEFDHVDPAAAVDIVTWPPNRDPCDDSVTRAKSLAECTTEESAN